MANNIKLIVFPVKDLDKAKKFYSTFLGTEPYIDGPYYVGYRLDDREVGLDPNGKAVVSYIDVEDIEASLKTLKDAGAQVVMDSMDVGAGLLVAQVELEGNFLGLRQRPK
jgi:predicted enzyme related to lactoylglutathione lyase